ncbi:MAG TPA: class I SAM-dependent methyltransferase [Gaiellaceae bacterium]|nr:class I SAM-dependent methyltransferase [Gaiellaceae bacterium]
MVEEGLQGAYLGERASSLSAAGFDHVHAAAARNKVLSKLAALAYEDDYPAEVEPMGTTTWWTLGRCVSALRVGPGATLVDLACGRGGPGLWLARATGADLVGIDWSQVAIIDARQRTGDFLPTGRARFEVGDLEDSGLPGGEADAVLCLDAVLFASDRVAALREVRRLLRDDGRYVFTATEAASADDASSVTAWRPLLAAAGLALESKEEVPRYTERLRRMYRLWLDNLEMIKGEIGADMAATLEQEAHIAVPRLRDRRQFLFVARP